VPVPREARPVGAAPDRVVGSGTPDSCTSRAVVAAVAKGGVIHFDCGPAPVTIAMKRTAKVLNTSKRVVLDGGGLVTLDGRRQRRILYQNTCDRAQVWTTSHCDDQATPRLVVQHLAFKRGKAGDELGGGAVFVRGGRFKVVDSTFRGNRCRTHGPDVGGAALRVFDQSEDRPVYVVGSRFERGRCSNGSAISSIGVSWVVLNSVFRDNRAVGSGANPARPGTRGGGSGGAIYLDGNKFRLRLSGTLIEDNRAREGGGAVFFVSNDRSGTLRIDRSTLRANPSKGFETTGLPGIFYLGKGDPVIRRSVLD
ncbi:MAG: hypothetical protein WBQ50_10315, partial [Nocardioides sp.]